LNIFSLSLSIPPILAVSFFLHLPLLYSPPISSLSLSSPPHTQKDDVRKMRKRLIEQQSAHMVNVFEEHFHMGPTGPSKMFQLHAEGELVGFIVGGYAGRKIATQHCTDRCLHHKFVCVFCVWFNQSLGTNIFI
jgi:hypothetical protein